MSGWFSNTFVHRVLYKGVFMAVMGLCAFAGAFSGSSASSDAAARQPTAEWPTRWDGAPLRPLALSAVERRFAQHFPGSIARLTNGKQVLVWRHVSQATRMLHPAADCYRSLGYSIQAERLERDASQRLWRCFSAERAGARAVRVCERIEDAQGAGFTDTSAWYWAAITSSSQGPWQAITVATPL